VRVSARPKADEVVVSGCPESMGVDDGSDRSLADRLPDGPQSELGSILADLPGPFTLVATRADTGDTTLARDRLGRERIFFGTGAGEVRFGPGLVGLARGLDTPALSAEGLCEVLAYRWSQGTRTVVAGVGQVPPGGLVRLDPRGRLPDRTHFWTLPVRPEPAVAPMAWWVDRAEAALGEGVGRVLKGARRPFVLLSGGVDSSLLAAVGHGQRPDLVAVTPTWEGAHNPELDRARAFAGHLGIEHRVMVFRASDAAAFAPRAVRLFGGAVRDFHMMVLAWVFEQMGDEGFDLVLHGQAADTIFGSGNLRFRANYSAKRRWLGVLPAGAWSGLGGLLPERSGALGRLRYLLTTDLETAVRRRQRLLHRPELRRRHARWLAERDPVAGVTERMPRDGSPESRVQVLDFYQGTVSHMATLTAMARPSGIAMGYPFLTPEVLDVALALPDAYKERDGLPKPVARDLGARHYPRDWVEAPKLGFPTPTVRWLRGPLGPWVAERLGPGSWTRRTFGDPTVDALSPERDFELIWTLAGLEEFLLDAFPGVSGAEVSVVDDTEGG
jgi:asparagine synthase (glutamine-hydrolysing)